MKAKKSKFVRILESALVISSIAYSYSASALINGTQTNMSENSHHLVLMIDGHRSCGASILNDYWAVTAAHCVVDLNTEQPFAASRISFISKTNRVKRDLSTHKTFGENGSVRHQATKHKVYTTFPINEGSAPYGEGKDLAIVQVSTPFPADLDRVKLLSKEQMDAALKGQAQMDVTVTGYGEGNAEVNGIRSLELAHMDLLSKEQCGQLTVPEASDPGTYRVNSNNVFCATGRRTQQTTCGGDSGGGLIIRDASNTPYILGVVSIGTGGSGANTCTVDYGLFARVDNAYRDITNLIKEQPTSQPQGCPAGYRLFSGQIQAGSPQAVGGLNGQAWYQTNVGSHVMTVQQGNLSSRVERYNTETKKWEQIGAFAQGNYNANNVAAGYYRTLLSSQQDSTYGVCMSLPYSG